MRHYYNTPVEDWPLGWLLVHISELLWEHPSRMKHGHYCVAHPDDRDSCKTPSTREQMVKFVKKHSYTQRNAQ